MKTFYYSINTGKSWENEKQYLCECLDWNVFVRFCKYVATSKNTEVRGCTSMGTDNQGHYFCN